MSGTAKARRTPGAKVFTKQGWDRRMRDARKASGLSVEEVAKALSLSPSSVRQWERGHQFPSRDNMEEFAEATNVDMVWLITGYESTR